MFIIIFNFKKLKNHSSVQLIANLRALFRVFIKANIGPKRFHQNRIVSWLTSTPRS